MQNVWGLFSLLLVSALSPLSCKGDDPRTPKANPDQLRIRSLSFMQHTKLISSDAGASGSSATGFHASTFESASFWPAVPLVFPARAAAFINESFGASNGFTYQSFEFTSTSCSASAAFARYFAAIEKLRGSSLSQSEKDEIQTAFQSGLVDGEGGTLNTSVCLLYDLMACIADYSVTNEAIFKQAATTGDFSVILTGAVSCIAEVTGIDPTVEPALRGQP